MAEGNKPSPKGVENPSPIFLTLATAAWNHVLALHTSEFERRENSSSLLSADISTLAWHERSKR